MIFLMSVLVQSLLFYSWNKISNCSIKKFYILPRAIYINLNFQKTTNTNLKKQDVSLSASFHRFQMD